MKRNLKPTLEECRAQLWRAEETLRTIRERAEHAPARRLATEITKALDAYWKAHHSVLVTDKAITNNPK